MGEMVDYNYNDYVTLCSCLLTTALAVKILASSFSFSLINVAICSFCCLMVCCRASFSVSNL